MGNQLNIAIIGYGAIAGYVARALAGERGVVIQVVVCRAGRKGAARRALGLACAHVTSARDITGPVDVALECAGHGGLRAHGGDFLAAGCDVITVSSGALANDDLAAQLADAARRGGSRLQLLSGAIGGLDGLRAAAAGGLDEVIYTGRKPPAGWKGTPAAEVLDLNGLKEAAVHFTGNARDAALAYPQNANVAATIALAGAGWDKTRVELIADPAINTNRHEISARGAFGQFTFAIEGRPLPGNPKSSALTAMAVVAAVRARLERVAVE